MEVLVVINSYADDGILSASSANTRTKEKAALAIVKATPTKNKKAVANFHESNEDENNNGFFFLEIKYLQVLVTCLYKKLNAKQNTKACASICICT